MKQILGSAVILSFLFFFGACSNTKQLTSQTEVLFRKNWALTELQGQPVPDTTRSSFEFTPGRISGTTGCNRLAADFVAGKNQSIRFSPGIQTRMACPDQASMALETQFLEALAKSTKWEMKGGELWLGDGTNALIKLRSL